MFRCEINMVVVCRSSYKVLLPATTATTLVRSMSFDAASYRVFTRSSKRQQTSSKCIQNTRELLDVCWIV